MTSITLPVLPGRKKPFCRLILDRAITSADYDFQSQFLHGHKLMPGTLTFMIDYPAVYQLGDGTRDNKTFVLIDKSGKYIDVSNREVESIVAGTLKAPAVPKTWQALQDFTFPAPEPTWFDEQLENDDDAA